MCIHSVEITKPGVDSRGRATGEGNGGEMEVRLGVKESLRCPQCTRLKEEHLPYYNSASVCLHVCYSSKTLCTRAPNFQGFIYDTTVGSFQ